MTSYAFRGQQCANLARRRTVAAWVESLTGVPVPTSCDHSFRAALKDGVLLCKLMNRLKPYSVKKVVCASDELTTEEEQSARNITNFLKAAGEFGLDPTDLFQLDDILEDTWRDRPRVVECLYLLQRRAEEMLGDDVNPDGDGTCVCDSYSTDSQKTDSVYDYATSTFDGMDPEVDFTTPRGINKLMDQCTAILRDRGARGEVYEKDPIKRKLTGRNDGNAMRCLESMLKQILAGITTAQERRGRRDLEESEKYIKSLEDQIELLQKQPQATVCDTSGLTSDEVISLRKTCDELTKKLEEYQREKEELEHTLERELKEKQQLAKQIDSIQDEVQSLGTIRGKYKEVQQENCKLYNMVQDLRGNIRVFCRVRPLGVTGDIDDRAVTTNTEDGKVLVSCGAYSDRPKAFKFDKVFGEESTQEEVYAETQPLIRSVLDGYNVCIFAYGQTGSGKTHTMSGTHVEEYSGRGINYRALDDLFEIKRKRSDEVDYQINVQMLEIYNENLRDLLFDYATGEVPPKLEIRSTQESGCNVPEAVQHPVSCTDDVLEVMEMGSLNRSVGSTAMNERSSRSHSVLTVIVDGYSHVTQDKTHACLHLVDLAGSERVGRSEATGDRLKEAQYINKSLSSLGDVMSNLAAKNSHVPFRNSKLTQLLKDSLSGQAKSMMFMHISPELLSRGETMSTLNFGFRVSQITLGQATKNVDKGSSVEAVNKLKRVASAKDEKIIELQRVIESERAVVRKAESDKLALEKQLKSLREELQLSQRTLMQSRSLSRRKSNAEEGSVSLRSRTKKSTPPQQPTVPEAPEEDTSLRQRLGLRTLRSGKRETSIGARLFGRKKSAPPDEAAARGRSSSRGSRLLNRESPSRASKNAPIGRQAHRKTISMTSREAHRYPTGAMSNPRRAAMKKAEENASRGAKWR